MLNRYLSRCEPYNVLAIAVDPYFSEAATIDDPQKALPPCRAKLITDSYIVVFLEIPKFGDLGPELPSLGLQEWLFKGFVTFHLAAGATGRW